MTNNKKGSKFYQYFASIAGNLCNITGGTVLGWTSSTLRKLEQNNPITEDNPLGIAISKEESSWIGSLTPVGALVGSFIAGYLAERYGRKRTMLLSAFPFIISWLLIAEATSVEILYLSRFIAGLAMAIPFAVLPMYIGEIGEISIRGLMGSLMQPSIAIGMLWAYCIGPYVSYNILWLTCIVLPIIFFITFSFMPESPYYLSAQGKDYEVIEVLAKLRGMDPNDVKAEAHQIQKTMEDAYRTKSTFMDLLRVKVNFKALVCTCSLIIFQQFTGINVIIFYAQTIFDAAGTGDSISSALSTIIVGFFSFLPSCFTPFIVDRWGRKILLNVSATGQSISLIALGLFFYLQKYGDVSSLSWLPVSSLIMYITFYSFAWGPLPWTIMGEMFGSDIKSKASGITTFISWTLAFIITKYFSNVAEAVGMYTAFWMFAVFCILSIFFTILYLPETKGKSLQQIQAELAGYSNDATIHTKSPVVNETC